MPTISTLLIAASLTPIVEVSVYNLNARFNLTNGIALANDSVQCFTILRNARMFAANIKARTSLGTGATVRLQRNRGGVRIDLTAATAAATVDAAANSALLGSVDLMAGDIIEIFVGGANVTAAAGVEVDLILQH